MKTIMFVLATVNVLLICCSFFGVIHAIGWNDRVVWVMVFVLNLYLLDREVCYE